MIPVPTTTKPLSFSQKAEAWLAGKLASWVADIKGTPLEPHAIQYARQEGWLMPNEGLEAVTVLNLMPMVDVAQAIRDIKAERCSEVEAKQFIAVCAMSGIREANAGVERVRFAND